MQVFVPIEEIPEGVMLPGALVPYQVGMRLAGRGARSPDARVAMLPPERSRRERIEAPGELVCCDE